MANPLISGKQRHQNIRPTGKCIFCGRPGVTHEHLFSDWLRDLFPRSAADTHTIAHAVAWTPRPTFVRQVRQGHSGTRTVRKVCRPCNSGWISKIDNAANRFAPPLIQGQSITVTQEAQQALATWFAKIATVADARRPADSVVLQSDRDWIMRRSLPPLLWQVWISSYQGTDWRDLALFQHGGILDLTEVTGNHKLKGYVTATTFGIGNLVALVIGSEHPQIEINIGTAVLLLKRIWPSPSAFRWPLDHVLSDADANDIAEILRHAVANPRGPR
jgi:hypothetical protein